MLNHTFGSAVADGVLRQRFGDTDACWVEVQGREFGDYYDVDSGGVFKKK